MACVVFLEGTDRPCKESIEDKFENDVPGTIAQRLNIPALVLFIDKVGHRANITMAATDKEQPKIFPTAEILLLALLYIINPCPLVWSWCRRLR